MRIAFFGTGSFAVPALRALAPHVVLTVAQPGRPSGRGLKIQPSPVEAEAIRLGIECATPEKARDAEFVERLQSLDLDALVVASYGQILSQKVLDSARRGGINLHGSILPAYRGAAPIQRAVLDGAPETGITLMQMDRGMDTGDMIAIERTPIGPDETYGELQDRLAEIAADMVRRWMPRIVAGEYERTPQDSAQATLAPKVEKAEAELTLADSADQAYRRFRAFTPNPGAFVRLQGATLRLWQVRLGEGQGEPGTVASVREGLEIVWRGGTLRLIEVQPEGKKRMLGRDYANGARLTPGTRLELAGP